MLRCCRCGAVFSEDDADYRQECVGEFWGAPAFDRVDLCPECESDDLEDFEIPYEECENCKECDYNCDSCEFKKKMEEDE